MREIKFRAWTKDSFNKPFMLSWEDLKDPMYYLYELNDADYNFMQYTGLKDKSGKEIYEGDILKWIDEADDTSHWFGPIKFGEYIDSNDKEEMEHTGFYLDFNDLDGGSKRHIMSAWYVETCEVIGNIYENPELHEY